MTAARAFRSLSKAWYCAWAYRGRAGWSLADQVIVSLGNLVAGLLLLRLAPPSEYGAYVLVLAAYFVAQAVQSALITGPMTVLGAGMGARAFSGYARSALALQGLAGLATAGLVILCSRLELQWLSGASTRRALGVLGLAVLGMQLQEFFRRVLITRLRMKQAALNDLLHHGLRLAGLVALPLSGGGALSAPRAIGAYAVAAALASAVGFMQVRSDLSGPMAALSEACKRHWAYGRWQLASAAVSLVYAQGLYFALAAQADEQAVGMLEGPRLIVAPCMLIVMAWGNLACPLASRAYTTGGYHDAARVIRQIALPMLVGVLATSAAVCLAGEWVMGLVLGRQQAYSASVLNGWAVVMVLIALSTAASTVFHATQRPRYGTWCRLLGAAAGVGAMLTLSGPMTPANAVWVRVAAEGAIAAATLVFAARLHAEHSRAGLPVAHATR